MVLGGWGFGMCAGCDGGALMHENVTLIKDTPQRSLAPSTT